jgi:hypothetical protein
VPETRKRLAWIGVFAVVLVGGLFGFQSLATPKIVRWSVENGKLQIHSRVWSDDFPLRDLNPEASRILDLNREPDWRPQKKIWGYNGFGYHAGIFRLRNGKEVSLYLTSENIAVLIPRRKDVPVMVGTGDPQALITALKRPEQ